MFYSLCEVYNRRWEILWRWGGQKYILDNLYLHLHVLWPNIWHILSFYSYFISLCLGRFIDFFYLMLIICQFSLHNSISLSKDKLHSETDIFSIKTLFGLCTKITLINSSCLITTKKIQTITGIWTTIKNIERIERVKIQT